MEVYLSAFFKCLFDAIDCFTHRLNLVNWGESIQFTINIIFPILKTANNKMMIEILLLFSQLIWAIPDD